MLSTESGYNLSEPTKFSWTSWLCSKEFCFLKVYHRKIIFGEIWGLSKIIKHSQEFTAEFEVFPTIFVPSTSPTSSDSTRHIWTKGWTSKKNPWGLKWNILFSQDLKVVVFLRVPFVRLDLNMPHLSSGFFLANPVWFHLMVSIKMDKSKAAMKMPERWWPQMMALLKRKCVNPKSHYLANWCCPVNFSKPKKRSFLWGWLK